MKTDVEMFGSSGELEKGPCDSWTEAMKKVLVIMMTREDARKHVEETKWWKIFIFFIIISFFSSLGGGKEFCDVSSWVLNLSVSIWTVSRS